MIRCKENKKEEEKLQKLNVEGMEISIEKNEELIIWMMSTLDSKKEDKEL